MRSNKKAIIVSSILLGVSFLWVIGCQTRNPILARIGGKQTVTLNELNDFMAKNNYRADNENVLPSEAEKWLNRLVDNKIFVMSAYRQKLFRDSSIVSMMEYRKKNIMLQDLFSKLNIDPIVKKADIRQYYAHMGKEVNIRIISFKLPPDALPEEEKQVRTKANGILKKLKSGEPFSELARFFSEDNTTAPNGDWSAPCPGRGRMIPFETPLFR